MRSRPSISPRPSAARSASRRQVGCTLTCTFCHTGTQRLVRNLTAEEIVAQVILARDRLGEWPDRARRWPIVPSGGALRHQYRVHGHGRAALQFRRGEARDRNHLRRRRTLGRQAPHHGLDLGRGAGDRASAANSAPCWRSRCTPPATSCATSWCRSTRNIRSRSCSRPAATIRASPTRGASPSNT